jgi:hypothetical protein
MSNLNYRNAVDNFANQQDEKLAKEIAEKQDGGSIYIGISQVDCDQVEFTSRAIIPASLKEFKDFDERVYMEAEGGYSLSILTSEEYANWMQPSIDHRAEQYNY